MRPRTLLPILSLTLVVATFALDTRPLNGQQPGQAERPRYKGIFEPIHYQADLTLLDVHFATADVGWVAGGTNEMEGGVLLHTRDSGETWEIQLGDPQSSDRAFRSLRFYDATHGWVIQQPEGMLYRTTDGLSWTRVGKMNEHYADYAFSSPSNGVYVQSTRIVHTSDGGKTWTDAFQCGVRTQVDGLWRNAECLVSAVQFVSAQIGYAIGEIRGYGKAFVFLRTDDGGRSWGTEAFPTDEYSATTLSFRDESTGFVRLRDGAVYATGDGGRTWNQAAAQAGERIHLRGSVGWSFLRHTSTLSFTTDGGRRWTTRDLAMPAMVNAFSLPRSDRAFVVGDHGMIYRYRVVPADDPVASGVLVGPAMPAAAAVDRE